MGIRRLLLNLGVPVKSLTNQIDGLSVLVVDDNRDAADTLGSLLEIWGYHVRVVYDGLNALAAVAVSPPDFLFLDLGMPSMDGYAIARCIRHEFGLSEIRIIALTAYSDDDHVRRVWNGGFNGYLTKPADPVQIKRILEGKIEWKAPPRSPLIKSCSSG
jgi:CheY-like chemotaxis protein